MNKTIATLATALATIFMAACDKSGNSDPFKPSVNGRNGEVLVVLNDNLKNDTVGSYIANMLTQPYLGLPSSEPIFDMQTVPWPYFSKMMQAFRNIILVEMNDTVGTDTIQYLADVWAKSQVVISAKAKSEEKLVEMFDRHNLRIISYISRAERNRLISFNKRTQHIPLGQEISKKWNIDIVIPNTFTACNSADPNSMSWFSVDLDDYQTGMFIYDIPYVGEGSLSKEYLLDQRDKLLRRNVGGPDGSYMCTEVRFGLDEIIYKSGKQNGFDVAELRGLWRMEGYMMGGPFILRAMHDTINNRILVADGYVYYPSKDRKRNFIRQLEAIMYTIDIKKKPEDSENN